MLRSLYVRDYALIEELEVEFGPGLNVVTGETGAGKSIIIGALKMVLGERASTEVIRSGARKAVIEGVFDHVQTDRLTKVFVENGLEINDTVLLRREISESQSRAFINDSPATLSVMRDVVGHLIDLHGQHEHQSLLRTETHLELIDSFGSLDSQLADYTRWYREVRRLVAERQGLAQREQELRQQKELIEYQIEEIDRLQPQAGEEDHLEAEQRVLENAETLFEATARLHQQLYESDRAIYDQLVEARRELERLISIDSSFESSLSELRGAEIAIAEIGHFLQDYNANIEFSPDRLETIRQRLGDLDLLKRKYGGSLESVLAHREDIGETYELASDFEGAIKRIDEETLTARKALSRAATALSDARRRTADETERAVEAELHKLGMPHARFLVRIEQIDDPAGWVSLGDENTRSVKAFPDGIDQVEFFISTNLGEEPRALVRVASGGEISRIMLGLKTVLARSEQLPILVFDEIDVGISGAMAQRVGSSLRNLAESHQIIAITHHAQIAAMGNRHYLVEKEIRNGRTQSVIRSVEEGDRARVIASLISGSDVSNAAIASARELLAAGKN